MPPSPRPNAGAKVYLIEQNDAMGGSIRYAGGTTSAAGAQMQIDAGVEDSPENFAADIERMGGGTNVPELTKKHTENAAAAVDWLDSLGVDFGDRQPHMSSTYDAFNVPREYRVQGGGNAIAEAVKGVLNTYIEDGSVCVLLNTRVDDIILEDGAVVGVVIDNEEATEYRADAVILATGGYGHNEELIHRYNFENVLTMAPSFVTGDGYVFAEKAGAVFNNMDYLPAYPGGVPVDGFDLTCSAQITDYNNTIWVDVNGERLVKEIGSLDSERKAAYSDAEHNLVYIVFPQSVRDTQESVLNDDEDWAYFDELLAEGNCVYSGETLEELAANAGIDAEGLLATAEKVNSYIDAGEDADFGRDTTTMAKLEDGPFYAVKTCPYVMLTKGGPLMNADAQVLNADNEPIPGLYECGELAGGANIGGQRQHRRPGEHLHHRLGQDRRRKRRALRAEQIIPRSLAKPPALPGVCACFAARRALLPAPTARQENAQRRQSSEYRSVLISFGAAASKPPLWASRHAAPPALPGAAPERPAALRRKRRARFAIPPKPDLPGALHRQWFYSPE